MAGNKSERPPRHYHEPTDQNLQDSYLDSVEAERLVASGEWSYLVLDSSNTWPQELSRHDDHYWWTDPNTGISEICIPVTDTTILIPVKRNPAP